MTRRRVAALLALGVRSIRVARGSAVIIAVVVLTSASAVLLITGLLAAANVAVAQDERIRGRTPVHSDSVYFEDGSATDTVVSAVAEPFEDEVIHRIAVAVAGEDDPIPPGIRRFPESGELFLSPALRTLRDRDDLVQTMLPGEIAGIIAPEGLSAPDELVAWSGHQPGSLAGSPLTGYGGELGDRDLIEEAATFGPPAMAIFVLAPLAAVMAATTRLSARVRERRLLALRTLGLSRRQTVAVSLVEMATLCTAGALLGVAFLPLAKRLLGTGPVAGVRFYPSDLSLAPAAVVAVALGVVTFCLVISAIAGTRVADAGFLGRPTLRLPAPRRVAVVLLALGVLGIALDLALAGVVPPGPAVAVLYLSVLGAAVGIATGLPTLLVFLAARIASHCRHVGWLLALRRLAANPGPPSRIVAPVCALLFAVASFLPVLDQLGGDEAFAAEQAELQVRGGRQVAVISGLAAEDAPQVAMAEGTRTVIPIADAFSPTEEFPTGQVMIATCEQINTLALVEIKGCPDEPWSIVTTDSAGDPGLSGTRFELRTERDHEPVELPPVGPGLDLGLSATDNVPTQAVIKPESLGAVTSEPIVIGQHLVVLDPTDQAVAVLRATVAGLSPAALVQLPYEAGILGTFRFLPLVRFLVALATISAVLTTAAVLVAGLQVALERRRELAALQVVGSPMAVLRQSQFLVVALPAFLGVTLASGLGLTVGLVWDRIAGGNAFNLQTTDVLMLAGVALATAALVAAATTAGMAQRPSPESWKRD